MATSPEAFRQVKDILRKLDQSIDSARARRLGNVTANTGPTTPQAAVSVAPTTIGQPNPTNGLPLARPLNRAKPLIRDDQHSP